MKTLFLICTLTFSLGALATEYCSVQICGMMPQGSPGCDYCESCEGALNLTESGPSSATIQCTQSSSFGQEIIIDELDVDIRSRVSRRRK